MKPRTMKAKPKLPAGIEPKPADAGGNKDVQAEAKTKTVGITGPAAGRRLDRARGGRADKAPLSASSSKNPFSSAGKC